MGYLFSRQGVIQVTLHESGALDGLLEAALEAGAEDLAEDEEGVSAEVLTTPENFQQVRDTLAEAGFSIEEADVTERPAVTVEVDTDNVERVLKLLERLDELDDVQNVYSNASFPANAFSEA